MSIGKDIHLLVKYKKPFRIIEDALPESRKPYGSSWYAAQGVGEEDLLVLNHLMGEKDVFGNAGIDVLRQQGQRRILRLHRDAGNWVMKGFPFYGSVSRQLYRHCFFAFDEAAGLILAAERGVSVPAVLAYGEGRKVGRRLWNAVVMHSIENAFHPTEVFRREVDCGLSVEDTLQRVIPMMLQIYHAGCNHIDLHGTSFLLSRDGADFDRVIDLQYAVFYDSPSTRIFCHQIAHFMRASYGDVNEQILVSWAEDVLEEAGGRRFKTLLDRCVELSKRPVPSAYQRMTLKP